MKQKTKKLLIEMSVVLALLIVLLAFMIPKFLAVQGNINTSKYFPDENLLAIVRWMMAESTDRPFTRMQAAGYAGDFFFTGSYIKDLTGMEFFTKITKFVIGGNEITRADLSRNPALREVRIERNKLTELIAQNNPKLFFLNCSDNQISHLDLSGCTGLKILVCSNNNLQSLDLTHNTQLEIIEITNNRFSSLSYLSNLPNLKSLNIKGNPLSEESRETLAQWENRLGKPVPSLNPFFRYSSGLIYDATK